MNRVWLALMVIAMAVGCVRQYLMESSYGRSIANLRAEIDQANDSLINERRVFNLSLNEVRESNDSIIRVLDSTRDELKIKEKRVKSLQYLASVASKVDTLILNDTIFIRDYRLDTIIKDEWSSIRLKLAYPDTIVSDASFRSEKHIIIHKSMETINKPHKFFLFRWFQKKHTVVKVNVVEKNPYITSEENKFIEVE